MLDEPSLARAAGGAGIFTTIQRLRATGVSIRSSSRTPAWRSKWRTTAT